MGLLDSLLSFFQDFLESLFASSSPEYKKKQQLKQLATELKAIEPPIYRPDGFILPAFPATLYQASQFLQPVKETLNATIASPDKRTTERCRDYLIELAMSEEQRALRKSFTFSERSAALVAQTQPPERIIEEQGKRFGQFLKILDTTSVKQAGIILQKMDFLVAFCQFDFNSFFSFFDPAFKAYEGQDTTVESPSFNSIEVTEILPSLMDLYYLLSNLDLNPGIVDIVAILDARKNNVPLGEDTTNKMHKIFQAVTWLFQKRISKTALLAIIRLTKDDPAFMPEQPVDKTDYVLEYKNRLTEFFHSDSRKLLKDQQDNEIQTMIRNTFGSQKLEALNGYNETTNSLLQEFTPFSLEWIMPLEIIKTFSRFFFDPHFKQIFRSVVVEGYFNNRGLQTTLATAYYYCEAVPTKFQEFEHLFEDNQPCNVKILTGYLSELKKGMDFEKPLRKMVENMNGHAKAFIQQAVNQYAEVFNFSMIILEDSKKPVPEYITNIRVLASSTKNSESYSFLEKEIGVFHNFLEIMKKYAIVGTLSVPGSLTEQTES
jgi:hypothetical protein